VGTSVCVCVVPGPDASAHPQGRAEREQCYSPLLEQLGRRFPGPVHARSVCVPFSLRVDVSVLDAGTRRRGVRVLVPGAGLGRLVHDIAALGAPCFPLARLPPYPAPML
jgi:hypothetical protein